MIKKLLICMLLLPANLHATSASTEPKTFSYKGEHEKWWEKCLVWNLSFEKYERWCGDMNALSRKSMRKHLINKKYKSILDAGCGLCIDYYGIQKSRIPITYQGIDITKKFVDRAKKLNIPVLQASIENIPFESNNFECVYARQIIERLDYYERAFNELIRVAQKEVMIVFWLEPSKEDVINQRYMFNEIIYRNYYDKKKLENFLRANPKVNTLEWEKINGEEIMLHIYLTQ